MSSSSSAPARPASDLSPPHRLPPLVSWVLLGALWLLAGAVLVLGVTAAQHLF